MDINHNLYKKALKKLKGNEQIEHIVREVMFTLSQVSSSYRLIDIEKCIEVQEELLHIGYNCKWSTKQTGALQLHTEQLFNFLIYLKRYERALYWIDKCITIALDDNEACAYEFIQEHPIAKEKVLNALEANQEVTHDDYKLFQHDVKELIDKREIIKHHLGTNRTYFFTF